MLSQKEIKTVKKTIRDVKEHLPFVFQALADPTRLHIFKLLGRHQDLCVTDLAKVLNVSVPAISYQLKIMEVVGLVEKERMGKMICYKLKKDEPIVRNVMKIIQ